MHTGFWWTNLGERDSFEDLGLDGTMLLESIFKKWDGGMEYIDLTQDWKRCGNVVNAVI